MKFHFLPVILLGLSLLSTASCAIGSRASRGFTFKPPQKSSDFNPFLVSSSGKFAAGIARASGGFSLVIAGVDSPTTLVPLDFIWFANPRRPFRSRDPPVFIFDAANGQLQLVSSSKESLWKSPTGGETLELQDTGNLVLTTNSSQTLWESFDSPADVLMQGQNFTQEMELVSETGEFHLRLEGDRVVLFADSEPYWALSSLREHHDNASEGAISSEVYMKVQNGFLGLYLSEQNRVHFEPFSSLSRTTGNFTRRMKLRRDGNLVVYYWQEGESVEDYVAPSDPCLLPNACGAFKLCFSSGSNHTCKCPQSATANDSHKCEMEQESGSCEASDQFLEVPGAEYFANDISALLWPSSAGVITSLEECRDRCLGNCPCQAFFFRNDTGACFLTGFRRSLQASGNLQNLAYIRVRNPEVLAAAAARAKRDRRKRVIGVSLLVLVVLTAGSSVAIGVCYLRRKWKEKQERNCSDDDGSSQEIAVLRDPRSIPSC